jgi:hypothetical protein
LIAPQICGHGAHGRQTIIRRPGHKKQRLEATDKDRIKGSVGQAKGVVTEAVGKTTGDAKLEVE